MPRVVSESYWQLLKRPEWQRMRLEKQQQVGWKCETCGDSDETLHVHHRQYFKNRKPWEYDFDQLIVLCDCCHTSEHRVLGSFKDVLSRIDTLDNAALIAGFNLWADWIDPGTLYDLSESRRHAHVAGVVAYLFMGLPLSSLSELRKFFLDNLPEGSQESNICRTRGYLFEELY